MAIHPSKDELSPFYLASYRFDKCDDVASHIEICPPCQETVNQLETEPDTLMDSLRRSSEPARLTRPASVPWNEPSHLSRQCRCAVYHESVAGKSAEHNTQHGQAATAQPDTSMPDFSVSAVSHDAPKIPTAAEIVANLKAANLLTDDDWNTIQPDIAAATDGMVSSNDRSNLAR